MNAYVETFLDSINNSDFGTVYEGEMSGVTSYEELSFQVIRADDKVISVVWGNEGYNQGAHGWYIQDYRNYYTQTGEKITFDSLGKKLPRCRRRMTASSLIMRRVLNW